MLDTLAENLNFIKLNDVVFFNILDTPFEPYDSNIEESLMKSVKMLTQKLTIFLLFC